MAALTFTPEVRLRIYQVAVAAVPLLLLLKVVTPEVIEPVLNIVSIVLGVGVPAVAASNVSYGPKDSEG